MVLIACCVALLYSFADELEDAYYILWHGNAAVNADFRVGDGNVGTGTLYADVVDATTAIRIAGVAVGSASGGIWSQDGDDAYYSLGAVGLGSVPPDDFTQGQLFLNNSYSRIGLAGYYPNILFYDFLSNSCIGGVTFDAVATPQLIFDASADLVGSVTITDTGVEAGYVSATSATVTDVTATALHVDSVDSNGLIYSDTEVETSLLTAQSADIAHVTVLTDISMPLNNGGIVNGLYISDGDIKLGTNAFTPTIFADEMTLFAADGNASGITLMSTNTSITAHIDAVTHPTITSRNAFSFGPESAADSTDQSRWIFKSDGFVGLYVYNDHIEFNKDRDTERYYIIMEQSENIKPATAGAPGIPGTFFFASGYIYYCTAGSSWGRVQLSAW